jgi:hypothetical protein
MSELTTAKQQLADYYIANGINVQPFIPERIVPPVVIVNAGATYLRLDTTGNGWVMALELTLVASQAVNQVATEKLDLLIENVLNHVPDFALVTDVTKPFILQANNAEYFATTVNLDLFVTI